MEKGKEKKEKKEKKKNIKIIEITNIVCKKYGNISKNSINQGCGSGSISSISRSRKNYAQNLDPYFFRMSAPDPVLICNRR